MPSPEGEGGAKRRMRGELAWPPSINWQQWPGSPSSVRFADSFPQGGSLCSYAVGGGVPDAPQVSSPSRVICRAASPLAAAGPCGQRSLSGRIWNPPLRVGADARIDPETLQLRCRGRTCPARRIKSITRSRVCNRKLEGEACLAPTKTTNTNKRSTTCL